MKKTLPISMEFIYQLFSLILIIIFVHAVYVGIIRPNADAILARQAEMLQKDKTQTTERSAYVLIRDYEQEACFVLIILSFCMT